MLDPGYQAYVDAELGTQEVADLLDELTVALTARHDVLIEISRNDRAILKDKD